MVDERVSQFFDACRAGSDDLRQPEMAPLAEHLVVHPEDARRLARVQQFDAAVRRSLNEVAVPTGLADRVSASLAAARSIDLAVENPHRPTASADGVRPLSQVEPASSAVRRASRLWLAVGAVAAAGLGLLLWYGQSESYTREDVLLAAAEFLPDDGQGILLSEQAPQGYPLGNVVTPGPHIRWQAVKDFLGHKAVVYRLANPQAGQKPASLIVVRLNMPPRPLKIDAQLGSAPRHKAFSTGGATSDCWQAGGYLYVLVVEGDQNRFRHFLRTVQPVA